MRTAIIISILFFFGCPAVGLQAQDSTAVIEKEYDNNILFLPALGSSPETGFMFGAVIVPQFKLKGTGAESRSSSIFFSGIYTTKNQILLSFLPEIIFGDEDWVLSGNYFVNYYPVSYWGIGPATANSDEVSVLYTQANIEQKVLFNMGNKLFLGPYLRWSSLYDLRFEDTDGEALPAPSVRGAEGNTSLGLGWVARWDRRNSNMTPTDNHFLEFSVLADMPWMGSTYSYTSYQIDARKYLNLSGDGQRVLAFQALAKLISGSPPFHDMSTLGGDRINRGYYSGRYRDHNAIQLQTELRQNIRGRLGFTVFAATGEVWRKFSDFNLQNYKWTAGGGLRFNLNKDDPTNIRIDYGFGKHTSGFYLQFGEAF